MPLHLTTVSRLAGFWHFRYVITKAATLTKVAQYDYTRGNNTYSGVTTVSAGTESDNTGALGNTIAANAFHLARPDLNFNGT